MRAPLGPMCTWLVALTLGAATASAAPIEIAKEKAAALPRNDAGPGICASITHVAAPANNSAPFTNITQVAPIANAALNASIMGLTVDGKVSRVFKDLNFRNAQPGSIGDFTGAGSDESYFPFSDTAEAMPRGNDRNFAARARGYVNVKKGGVVTIALNADDAASLTVAGTKLIETDERISARAAVQVSFGGPGLYPLELVYFQNGSTAVLEVSQADSAEKEGNLNDLDTSKYKLWPANRLFTTRTGMGDACQECGPGIAAPCPAATACVDGTCQSCLLPDSCGASCQRCPDGKRVCKAGACVQCATDFDCRAGQVCDPATSACVAGTACAKDADCPAPKTCDADRRVCVSGGTCAADSDCPSGRVCDSRTMRCVPLPCKAETDCPAGQTCNTDRQTCTPSCAADGDCAAGETCDAGSKRCVRSCRFDSQCQGGICDLTTQRCVPSCQGDLDCSQSQRCDIPRQRCAPFCRADADCGANQVCDGARSLCVTGGGKERYVGGIGCSAAPGGTAGTGPLAVFGALGLLGLLWLSARSRRRNMTAVIGAGLLFFSATEGRAQTPISVNALTFQPALGPESIITVEGTRTPGKWQPFASAIFEFSLRPLRLVSASGDTLANTVNTLTSLHLAGGIGLTRWAAIGVHLPVALYQQFDDRTPSTDVPASRSAYPFGIGDLRLWGKLRLFGKLDEQQEGFGIALVPQIMFPTGGNLRSGNSFDFDVLRAAADYRFKNGAIVSLNFGFLFRTNNQQTVRDLQIGHQVHYGLGGYLPVAKAVGLMAELTGTTSMEKLPFATGLSAPRYSVLEGHVGARWTHTSGLAVLGGLGTGFLAAPGSPQLRIFAGVSYAPFGKKVVTVADPDPDHDGVLGDADKCPFEAGPPENSGCPEKDTDKDTVIDRLDKCPTVPGLPENQGCPDVDTDKDGIIDRLDKCPKEPGPMENEGCPEKDTDKDTIIDRLDKCPFDPGPAPDGCPKRQFIAVKEDKIELLQKVYFATGKATINKGSFPLLDEVADVLRQRATMELRIEGHTDNTGPLELNMRLSRERAASVREYLIKKGIAGTRLIAEGYGPTKPVADNTTPPGRDKNRRTEFVILKQ